MKISVVGSINMDQTVTADRIPLKGETLHGDSLSYIPGGKGANQAVARRDWEQMWKCSDAWGMTHMDRS